MLFIAYFYLAEAPWRWLAEKPPKLHYVIPMLVFCWQQRRGLLGGDSR